MRINNFFNLMINKMIISFASVIGLSSAVFPLQSQAEDLTVVDVRRNITLSNDEIPYKDFYISGDGVSSLKPDVTLTALRRINVRDAAGAHSYGEIAIPVGELKIIAVYGKIAVAREVKLLSRDNLPMLEQIGIMSGDSIVMK